MTTYHTDMADLGAFMEVKADYLTGDLPAWTAVGVASLGGTPGVTIEIKAVAA